MDSLSSNPVRRSSGIIQVDLSLILGFSHPTCTFGRASSIVCSCHTREKQALAREVNKKMTTQTKKRTHDIGMMRLIQEGYNVKIR